MHKTKIVAWRELSTHYEVLVGAAVLVLASGDRWETDQDPSLLIISFATILRIIAMSLATTLSKGTFLVALIVHLGAASRLFEESAPYRVTVRISGS